MHCWTLNSTKISVPLDEQRPTKLAQICSVHRSTKDDVIMVCIIVLYLTLLSLVQVKPVTAQYDEQLVPPNAPINNKHYRF